MNHPRRASPKRWHPPALIAGAVIVVLALALTLTAPVSTRPFTDAQGQVIPGSIAEMRLETIGGVPQMLWFRGIDTHLPVLILLHGGPGASEMPLFRHFNADLERHFLVVYWEQRGTGRSFSPDIPPESMTIARFLQDLGEVVQLVRARFGKRRVTLLGHSWGTAIGLIYAHDHPENLAAYVGVGQIANMPEGERRGYGYALEQAKRRGDHGALEALQKLGPPPHTVSQMLSSRHWVEHFGGSFHAKLTTGDLIWAALNTDEASWVDLIRFGQGNAFSLEHLWGELSKLELDGRYRNVQVPIFFLEGRFDWQVPAVVAAAYFQKIRAPQKHLIWFEGSAHNVPFEEPERVNRVMIERVAPVARRLESPR
jgi:proline iminopeptidase